MSYVATINAAAYADGMPLWESPEQPTARAAYDLAEHHIHEAQPDDVIAPVDGWGEYAVWNLADGQRSTRVATLTVSIVADPSTPPRDPRVVGGRYRSGYWDIDYTVDAIVFDDRGWLTSITVTDKNGSRTHGTYWDPRDEILFDPRTAPNATEAER